MKKENFENRRRCSSSSTAVRQQQQSYSSSSSSSSRRKWPDCEMQLSSTAYSGLFMIIHRQGGGRGALSRCSQSRRQLFNFFSSSFLLLLTPQLHFSLPHLVLLWAKCPFGGTPGLPLMCPGKGNIFWQGLWVIQEENQVAIDLEFNKTYREMLIYYPVHQLKRKICIYDWSMFIVYVYK